MKISYKCPNCKTGIYLSMIQSGIFFAWNMYFPSSIPVLYFPYVETYQTTFLWAWDQGYCFCQKYLTRQNMPSITIQILSTRRPKCIYFIISTLPVKVSAESLENRELIFHANKRSIMKPCFRIFITHPLRIAGFVKFGPTLPQALGFDRSQKKLVDLVSIRATK